MTALKVLLAPFLFVLAYMVYVCIIGLIPAFLSWDITIITHTIFLWNKGINFNIYLALVSGILAIYPAGKMCIPDDWY